jgi:hypothetical protein
MKTADQKFIDPNKKPVTKADKLTLFLGIIGAIKILLAAPPFYYQIPAETFDAFVNLVSVVVAAVAMYRNNRRIKPGGITTNYKYN